MSEIQSTDDPRRVHLATELFVGTVRYDDAYITRKWATLEKELADAPAIARLRRVAWRNCTCDAAGVEQTSFLCDLHLRGNDEAQWARAEAMEQAFPGEGAQARATFLRRQLISRHTVDNGHITEHDSDTANTEHAGDGRQRTRDRSRHMDRNESTADLAVNGNGYWIRLGRRSLRSFSLSRNLQRLRSPRANSAGEAHRRHTAHSACASSRTRTASGDVTRVSETTVTISFSTSRGNQCNFLWLPLA